MEDIVGELKKNMETRVGIPASTPAGKELYISRSEVNQAALSV
jgi:hypothetical protein